MIYWHHPHIKIYSVIFFSISFHSNLETYACFYKANIETGAGVSYLGKPWNKHTIPARKEQSCECGKEGRGAPPWHLLIYVFDSSRSATTCVGTVINSKMILTSNNCLKIRNGKFAPYEWWDPQPADFETVFAKKDDIVLSTSQDPFDTSGYLNLRISQIIYNEKWIRSEMTKSSLPDDDVAILILEDKWDIDANSPICVPHLKDPYDPTGFQGFYYGTGGKLMKDPNPELGFVYDAFVLPGKLCDKDTGMTGFSTKETLCVQSRLPAPTSTGGALVMAEDGTVNKLGFIESKINFLLGLASAVKRVKGAAIIETTYFSSISPLRSYLEYYAARVGAEWCKTPSLKLDEKLRDTDFKKGRKRKYIWEVGPPIKRDESLDCDCVCGLHNLEKSAQEARIVGGEEAVPYEFPWLIQMEINFQNKAGESNGDGLCGGSIINNLMILTAAHCVIRGDRVIDHESSEWLPKEVVINYRVHEFVLDPEEKKISAKQVFYLRDYALGLTLRRTDYDLALVVLDKPLEFSNAKMHGEAKPLDVRPICLPREEKPIAIEGKNATVAGWGLTGDSLDPADWRFPDKARKLVKPILPLEECSKRAPNVLRDTVICAGYHTRYNDSSSGDSGGPLNIRSENGFWTQVGIVSFGVDLYDDFGAYSHTVSLYTNLQKFLRFVDYYSNKVGAKWCKSYV